MSIVEKIFANFGYLKASGSRYFTFTGNCNSPGFTINLDNMSGIREAYNKCSPVSAIINRTAEAMSNGEWWIVDDKNKDVSKDSKFKHLASLLKHPNPLQTRTELIKQTDIYLNLYGITYLYAVVPMGFDVQEATAIWALNPERVTPVFKQGVLYYAESIEDIVEKYIITIGNKTIHVSPKHILSIKDSHGDVNISESHKGVSRLNGLEYEIKNIIQAQEAIYSLNKDRGAQGIITNKSKDASGSLPLTPNEKEDIDNQYKSKYGLGRNQSKIIISDADLGWQQMTFNVRDLMLYEGLKQNTERISDSLNYPFGLLANAKGTTYANRDSDMKYLYQNNVIPRSNLYEEKLSEWFNLEHVKIEIDFSHIECLREAEKERAESLFKLNQGLQIAYKLKVITMEEYRVMLDLDEKPNKGTFYEGESKTNTAN